MPLTAKGEKIQQSMERPPSEGGYGKEKGEQVFYASKNKGTITGVDAAPYQAVAPGVTLADIQKRADALWQQPAAARPLAENNPRPAVTVYKPSDALSSTGDPQQGDESFKKLEGELEHKKGVHNPQALAAWIGRSHGKIPGTNK